MRTLEVQRKVRELIVETDRLAREAHAAQSTQAAEVFAALRSTLARLERTLGDPTRMQRLLDGRGASPSLGRRVRERLGGTWLDPARLAAEPILTAGYAAEGLLAVAFAASPFALGYARRRPLLTAGQLAVAAGYVAARIERSRAKKTDPRSAARVAPAPDVPVEPASDEPTGDAREPSSDPDAEPDETPTFAGPHEPLDPHHPRSARHLAREDESPIVPSAPIDVL